MRYLWLLLFCTVVQAAEPQAPLLTAEWAEQYLKTHDSHLLDDSEHDHVMSLYYFGHYKNRSLMGLERVRGDDYEQFFTLLVFEEKTLLGYYAEVLSFPATISPEGELNFPLGIRGYLEASQSPLYLGLAADKFTTLCLQQKDIRQCYPWHPMN